MPKAPYYPNPTTISISKPAAQLLLGVSLIGVSLLLAATAGSHDVIATEMQQVCGNANNGAYVCPVVPVAVRRASETTLLTSWLFVAMVLTGIAGTALLINRVINWLSA